MGRDLVFEYVLVFCAQNQPIDIFGCNDIKAKTKNPISVLRKARLKFLIIGIVLSKQGEQACSGLFCISSKQIIKNIHCNRKE